MGLFGIKSKAEKAAEQFKEEVENFKKEEEGKLTERYNMIMPKVKRYLESIGFELPPDENILFMQIDENTGNWKFGRTENHRYESAIKNENFLYEWSGFSKLNPQQNIKYIIQTKEIQRETCCGILLTSDGKAYIGAAGETFWWCTESAYGLDNLTNLPVHNILAVGNIKNQLLCGVHISDLFNSNEEDIVYVKSGKTTLEYTDSVQKRDYYLLHKFPKSVKRVFLLPSDEFEKKNTIVIGSSFTKCSNLRLFYCGFDKVAHEKLYCKDSIYPVFNTNTHATFIAPSDASLDFFNAEQVCKNWDFKVGTTIQNAVSLKEAKEAEEKSKAETKAKAESAEKANTLAETKAVLEQLENDLAAKKAEVASLGLDAQGIVQKAKLNKEIKDLESQIETLKAEVEKLSK